MGKQRLSKSAIKELNNRVAHLGVELSKKDLVDRVDDGDVLYTVNGLPTLIEVSHAVDQFIPHLAYLQHHPRLLPQVTVDMGAVRHVCNGADVMRPGIVHAEDFQAHDLVIIVDERHGKPIAVGSALRDASDIRAQSEGKAVASRHFVGDHWWNKGTKIGTTKK